MVCAEMGRGLVQIRTKGSGEGPCGRPHTGIFNFIIPVCLADVLYAVSFQFVWFGEKVSWQNICMQNKFLIMASTLQLSPQLSVKYKWEQPLRY